MSDTTDCTTDDNPWKHYILCSALQVHAPTVSEQMVK